MPTEQQSWLDGRGPQKVAGAAIGIAALMLGVTAMRQAPPPPPPPPQRVADTTPAPAKAPARAPDPAPQPQTEPAPPAKPVEPAAVEPLAIASDPARESADRSTWERLLAKTDDYMLRQAVAAGCDETRAERLRAAFAARRAARSADIAAAESGQIDKKTLRKRSAQAQSSLEREINQILTPAEQAALDAEAARAKAVADER